MQMARLTHNSAPRETLARRRHLITSPIPKRWCAPSGISGPTHDALKTGAPCITALHSFAHVHHTLRPAHSPSARPFRKSARPPSSVTSLAPHPRVLRTRKCKSIARVPTLPFKVSSLSFPLFKVLFSRLSSEISPLRRATSALRVLTSAVNNGSVAEVIVSSTTASKSG